MIGIQKLDIVRPSGKGRTEKSRGSQEGTVVNIENGSVFVQWHGSFVEGEYDPEELVVIGKAEEIPESGKVIDLQEEAKARMQ